MYNRRKFIKVGSLALAGAYVGSTLLQACSSSQTRLTILHTNDMHSRIEPFPNDHPKHPGLGGMAKRAELVKTIRSQMDNVLLLDSGDVFQGTPYFNFFGGELEFRLMSEMGYDATTIGNHDFDNGIDGLLEMMPNATFPHITSNYDVSKTILKGHTLPYKVFTKSGIRIGVFGLGVELDGLVLKNLYQETKYNNPVEVAKEMVQELNAKGCDLIICLSHLGYDYKDEPNKVSDLILAEKVSGIDLILGGHTHTYLDVPSIVSNSEGYETIINQVGWAGTHLGRIDFIFEKGTHNALPFEQSSLKI